MNELDSLRFALDWLDQNLAEFSLQNAQNRDDRLSLLKPIGELSLLSGMMKESNTHSDWCNRILLFCWEELRSGDELIDILAARPDLIAAITLYSCFEKAGFRNERLDRLIRYLSKTSTIAAVELPTWRRLDVSHGLHGLGIQEFPKNPVAGTWIEKKPEPWMISNDIGYAITHEIFYITDFGRSIYRLDNGVKSYVAQWTPTWLEIFSRKRNWDLFAEFLMVGACVGLRLDREVQLLASMQTNEGYFPGPSGSAENMITQDTQTQRATFLTNYHTTLVSAMALMMCA